jgi:hypothetical protein
MNCLLRPRNHTPFCAWCAGQVPAWRHIFWGRGCAHLCRRHAEGVRQAFHRGTHRVFEAGELKGQAPLPFPAPVAKQPPVKRQRWA